MHVFSTEDVKRRHCWIRGFAHFKWYRQASSLSKHTFSPSWFPLQLSRCITVGLSIHLLKDIVIVSCLYFLFLLLSFFPLLLFPVHWLLPRTRFNDTCIEEAENAVLSTDRWAEVSSYWRVRGDCVAVFLASRIVTSSQWPDGGNVSTTEIGKYQQSESTVGGGVHALLRAVKHWKQWLNIYHTSTRLGFQEQGLPWQN